MEDCIFCKIIKGDIPSYTIYENENIKVFMDINPIAKGHSLIVPKKHYKDLMDMDPNLLREIDEVIKEIYPKFKDRLGAEGLTRMQNNEMGQEVKHYHMHLIPRYDGDNLEPQVNEEANNTVIDTFELLK